MQAATELDIPIIDIHNEVFKIHPDPLSLFPFRTPGHYNAEGYRLIAEAIEKQLAVDYYASLNWIQWETVLIILKDSKYSE